jgi:hypothetical protein
MDSDVKCIMMIHKGRPDNATDVRLGLIVRTHVRVTVVRAAAAARFFGESTFIDYKGESRRSTTALL